MKILIFKILKKFMQFFNLYHISPPYEYVQNITLYNLHKYLKLDTKDIKSLIMVGGYLGHEIPLFSKLYPNLKPIIYEPSKRYFEKLKKKFAKFTVLNIAISDTSEDKKFYETSLRGSGSILKLGELSKRTYSSEQQESFYVKCNTLDNEINKNFRNEEEIDCLWVDVQGYELNVLKGSIKNLYRIKSIFIEISILKNLYDGSVIFEDLDQFLRKNNFVITQLGTDRDNYTGNALYINKLFLHEK